MALHPEFPASPYAPLSHRNGTRYDYALFHQAGFHNHKPRFLCRAYNFLS